MMPVKPGLVVHAIEGVSIALLEKEKTRNNVDAYMKIPSQKSLPESPIVEGLFCLNDKRFCVFMMFLGIEDCAQENLVVSCWCCVHGHELSSIAEQTF